MTKLFKLSFLIALLFIYVSCDDNDDEVITTDLNLNIDGLENLGPDYVYEGWIIVDGKAITTGIFSVNDNGELSKTSFSVGDKELEGATTFVLTIEPKIGDDPSPSDVHILAADFQNDTGQLSVSHPAAFGTDFNDVSGKFILATPTDGTDMNENSGIWFLDLTQGSPSVGLSLPELPDGWQYEGWAVINGVPVTTGKFDSVKEKDLFDGFSSTTSMGPPFPGEDFLMNAPEGMTFPVNLAGGAGVISIEPFPDNSSAPFVLKPLVGGIASDATDHVTYDMGQNLIFPSCTVKR